MNLEIANRLVALRKENNLSQEALAEKLGISRQAVSKWERAEASPDTDNLIALAKLYHISLDELLKIHEEDDGKQIQNIDGDVGAGQERNADNSTATQSAAELPTVLYGTTEQEADWNAGDSGMADDTEDVHVGFDGIHVKDKTGEVHVSWQGIHVHDKNKGDEVHIDRNGIYVNGDEVKGHLFGHERDKSLPLGIIAIVGYICIGACFGLWHPGWLIFFLVPIISTLIEAVRQRNPNLFAYPILAVLVFLYVGLVHGIWHPTWVIFLTIPVYYSIVGYFARTHPKDGEGVDTKL